MAIKKFFSSLLKEVVVLFVSILAAIFLLVCNVFAAVLYPLWAGRCPDKARKCCCISAILHSRFLVQLTDPLGVNSPTSKVLVLMQNILLRQLDVFVISKWQSYFATSKRLPMATRYWFIENDDIANMSSSDKTKFFELANEAEKKTLLRYLSADEKATLFAQNKDFFVANVRLTSRQFSNLSVNQIKMYIKNFDLNAELEEEFAKQAAYCLRPAVMDFSRFIKTNGGYKPNVSLIDYIRYVFDAKHDERYREERMLEAFAEYILAKGLKPSTVNKFSDDSPMASIIREYSSFYSQVVSVRHTAKNAEKFKSYLKNNPDLCYYAQVEMNTEQYKIYRQLGGRISDEAICTILSNFEKNKELIKVIFESTTNLPISAMVLIKANAELTKLCIDAKK